MGDHLLVAQVLAPHGLRGELKCRLVTDFPERFAPGLRLLLQLGAAAPRRVTVRTARVDGDHVFLGLKAVGSRDAAEELRGGELLVAREDAVKLAPGQFFWHEVIGLRVEDESGQTLGTVAEILPTGANDVYVVRGPRGELLIPAIGDVLREIDPTGGRMVVTLLPGLLPEAAPRRASRRHAGRHSHGGA